ncbi:MAG: hypothetical protein FJ241_09980, partial [Nitrospira sp.]|nr:hypothetical protein [Nitrospira sp.]
PEIALSVFVEHGGHGGGAAAPIAKIAIEEYLINSKLNPESSSGQDSKLGIQNVTHRPQDD